MSHFVESELSKWKIGQKFIVNVTKNWKIDAEIDGCDNYSITNIMEFKGIAWGDDINTVLYEFERLKQGFRSTLRKFKIVKTLREI